MQLQCTPFGLEHVQLKNGLFKDRFDLNLKYMMSLSSDNLLQNFYLEAGIKKDFHGALRATSHGDSGAGDVVEVGL